MRDKKRRWISALAAATARSSNSFGLQRLGQGGFEGAEVWPDRRVGSAAQHFEIDHQRQPARLEDGSK